MISWSGTSGRGRRAFHFTYLRGKAESEPIDSPARIAFPPIPAYLLARADPFPYAGAKKRASEQVEKPASLSSLACSESSRCIARSIDHCWRTRNGWSLPITTLWQERFISSKPKSSPLRPWAFALTDLFNKEYNSGMEWQSNYGMVAFVLLACLSSLWEKEVTSRNYKAKLHL